MKFLLFVLFSCVLFHSLFTLFVVDKCCSLFVSLAVLSVPFARVRVALCSRLLCVFVYYSVLRLFLFRRRLGPGCRLGTCFVWIPFVSVLGSVRFPSAAFVAAP